MRFEDVFYYDETSPSHIRWNKDIWCGNKNIRKLCSAGDSAGYKNQQGYWCVTYEKKKYLVHRIIWQLFNGEIPNNMCIDHIDRGRSNIINNLRLVTRNVNNRNKSPHKSNTSGITGVHLARPDGNEYWVASWYELTGKHCRKHFSVKSLGEEVAKSSAIDYRLWILEQLNNQGAEYSLLHIKNTDISYHKGDIQ